MARYLRPTAGRYRHSLKIQTFTGTRGPTGNFDKTKDADWDTDTDGNVKGLVQPLRGRERNESLGVTPEVTHKIEIRYIAGLMPDKRLKFGSRVFSIEFVINVEEKNVILELMCKEHL